MFKKITVISTDVEYCTAVKHYAEQFEQLGQIPPGVIETVVSLLDDFILERYSKNHEAPYDYLITPGNGYGIMSGGFDAAVLEMFPNVETNVRQVIRQHYLGEITVGNAFSVSADSEIVRRVVYAPTMRVPTELPPLTDVPYVSTLAALQVIGHASVGPISPDWSIIMTGHGVGTGEVPVDVVAWQQLMAIAQAIDPKIIELNELFRAAKTRHQAILRRL